MDLFDVLEEVRRRDFPSGEEKDSVRFRARELFELLSGVIEKTPGAEGVTPILVGSVAKNTFLKNPDIDLFIRFPAGTELKVLEEKGLALAREVLPDGVEKYAQHPYIMGEFKGLEADIVPCIEITPGDKVVSAVDRTPLHCEYVVGHLSEELREDVMLLKRFTKGVGVYGANEEYQGLSGYLCELLVIMYDGLEGVLKAARDWGERERLVLDGISDAGLKYNSPLVFIDPTDPRRNVAQAVSEESFALFKLAAGTFLDGPDIRFFYPNEPQLVDRETLDGFLADHSVFGIRIEIPADILPDHIYGQVRKTQRSLHRVFERNDIPVLRSRFYIRSSAYVLVAYERGAFDRLIDHQGPKDGDTEFARQFREKWSSDPRSGGEVFVKDGVLFVKRKPTYPDPAALLEASGESISWGKELKDQVGKMDTVEDEGAFQWEDGLVLSEFIQNRFPWEY